MRKLLIFFTALFLLSGCATYKFHHGKAPYDKGYVVSRDDYAILEYTVGKDNSVPKLKTAKERFAKRRDVVEDYYKRMGYIENRFKMVTWDPLVMLFKMVGGVFRLPWIAVSDYRYDHDPKYRDKIKKREAEDDAREERRINKLKEELNAYIRKELETEVILPEEKPVLVEEKPVTEEQAQIQPEVDKEPASEEKISKAVAGEISGAAAFMVKASQEKKGLTAVIIARPLKGYSPLMVRFDGRKSKSQHGRIIHYSWDFGDGDTSNKPAPVNTYWSASFAPKIFTVTLTVNDDKGNSVQTSVMIEVLNK